MRETLIASARNEARCPLRLVLPLGDAIFASMPAVVRLERLRALGAKLVTAFPGNAERGLPTHQAAVLLCDPETGAFEALVAGETITTMRTAAVSLVATQRLARRPCGTLAILGAGVQGRAHAEAFHAGGSIERLHIWSQSASSGQALAKWAAEAGIRAEVRSTPSDCVRDADVIVTATGSGEPLFAADDVPDGAHVNAVGACLPTRRELPAELVAEAAVYADSYAGAEREAGDLILAARDLGATRVVVRAELGEMLADPARAVHSGRVTIFESLGLGIEDVACAAFVASRFPAG